MLYLACAILGAVIGGVLAWVLAVNRTRSQLQGKIEEAERRANSAEVRAGAFEASNAELRGQSQRAEGVADQLRIQLETERGAKVKAETELKDAELRLTEERKTLEDARTRLPPALGPSRLFRCPPHPARQSDAPNPGATILPRVRRFRAHSPRTDRRTPTIRTLGSASR
jgi:hypothetical protein